MLLKGYRNTLRINSLSQRASIDPKVDDDEGLRVVSFIASGCANEAHSCYPFGLVRLLSSKPIVFHHRSRPPLIGRRYQYPSSDGSIHAKTYALIYRLSGTIQSK
jgi:hypothetical protein